MNVGMHESFLFCRGFYCLVICQMPRNQHQPATDRLVARMSQSAVALVQQDLWRDVFLGASVRCGATSVVNP